MEIEASELGSGGRRRENVDEEADDVGQEEQKTIWGGAGGFTGEEVGW